MSTYIALLRGINVSGQKSILMVDLKKLFESLKFTDVKTYIQSGNVVFRSAGDVEADKGAKGAKGANSIKSDNGGDRELEAKIEGAITKKYGFQVPVVVRTAEEMAAIIAANPFRKLKLVEKERVYVSYLSEVPGKEGVKKLEAIKSDVDEIRLHEREVYILCRGGYGETVFSNTLMEKCLGVKSTTRKLETTQKLVDMAAAV